MELAQRQRHEFSHNSLHVSGGHAQVQYGHTYNITQTPEPAWTDVCKWIFGPEPVFWQRAFQTSMQSRRIENDTGRWFLEGSSFEQWLSQPNTFLWLHGKTGCGKTMLCSSAIDRLRTLHLGSAKQALLYHFFTVSDRRSQTCDTLVRTLVYQISSHDDATRAHAKRHYLNEGGNGLADLDQLFSMLVDVASILSGTCIVIDALDECVDQKESCAFLEKFFKRLLPGVRILTSSNTTQARLTEVVLTRLNTEKVYIATPNVNRDIETHILDSDLDQWDDDQKSRIIRHITENSDGSFRWAIGQLEELQTVDTEDDLDDVLASLPKDLTQTYERILSKFTTASDIRHLRILLCWLMYAARPLRLEELRHTVAISWLGRPYFDHRKKLNQRPKVLDQCTFLITIDGTSDQGDIFAIDDDDDGAAAQSHNGQSTWHKDAVLRLAHASVLQFLQDTEKLSDHAKGFCLDPSAGNLTLAQSCIAYAIYLDGLTSLIPDPEVTPLFSYTIKYWYYHATEAGPGSTESMATLMKEALNTKWDIYRLLTYPNPSTRYNPWPERQSATQDRMSSDSPQSSLCRTCQTICRRELSGASGIEHQTYEMVILSSNQCKLCNMIHQALLHFGVARKCSASGKTSLSDKEAERLLLEMDEEISRNASAAKIWLKGEADDPFLLISCHCYLGRLHLYTTLGPPLAGCILGQPISHEVGAPSVLNNCAQWLRTCEEAHPSCREYTQTSELPPRLIDLDGDTIRLCDSSNSPSGTYATMSHCWGKERLMMLTKDSVELMYQRIEPAELPLSFANAVTVTRALGIRYLWIDALCIVQGDMGDFAANAPNMPDYFANGAINIVAGVQNSHSGFLHNRAKPQFLPLCINQAEDIYVGWLGTESYCDPRGINMNRFPDAWKYQSPPHTRAWIMQEIRLARRNLVFQADGNSSTGPLYLHTHDQALSAQLYMQCQKQIRWECGRTRSTSETASTDWYGLVEEYSGQQLTIERDRLIGFSSLAMRHSRESKTACGQYLAGLWSEDLFRGLLWRANDVRSRSTFHIAPSWSWASGSGLVKHVWPRNASVVAEVVHATTDDHYPDLAYIVVRGQLVEIKLMFELAAGWTGDITLQARTRDESYTSVRVRYFLDDARAFEQGRIYFLKITHRVALLLARTDSDRSEMERYGLVIVAKPDTQKWATAGVVKEVKII